MRGDGDTERLDIMQLVAQRIIIVNNKTRFPNHCNSCNLKQFFAALRHSSSLRTAQLSHMSCIIIDERVPTMNATRPSVVCELALQFTAI